MWLNDFVAAGHLRDVVSFHLDMDSLLISIWFAWLESFHCLCLSAGASQRRLPPAPGAHWLLPSYWMGFLSPRLLGSPGSCEFFSGFKWLGMSLQCFFFLVWITAGPNIPFLKDFECSCNMNHSFYYTRSFCLQGGKKVRIPGTWALQICNLVSRKFV